MGCSFAVAHTCAPPGKSVWNRRTALRQFFFVDRFPRGAEAFLELRPFAAEIGARRNPEGESNGLYGEHLQEPPRNLLIRRFQRGNCRPHAEAVEVAERGTLRDERIVLQELPICGLTCSVGTFAAPALVGLCLRLANLIRFKA